MGTSSAYDPSETPAGPANPQGSNPDEPDPADNAASSQGEPSDAFGSEGTTAG